MIDLHLHSSASDGELTPSRLVEEAAAAGVTTMALTDHDTISGVDEAIKAGKKLSVTVIPGIEISTSHKDVRGEIHLIGLFIDHTDNYFLEKLKILSVYRKIRNEELIKNFHNLSIELDADILFDNGKKNTSTIGKPDFARTLLAQNFIHNEGEAYGKYLDDKTGLAYVEKAHLNLPDAIQIIHKARGIAILAHPFHITNNYDSLLNIISEMTENGLDGIEVFYNNYNRKQIKSLKNIAKHCSLIKSGGSDLHYLNSSRGSKLGFYGVKKNIPDSLLDDMPSLLTY